MAKLGLKETQIWTTSELISKNKFVNPTLQALIEEKISSHELSSTTVIPDWLKWCEAQKDRVKVIDHDVPKGVLPDKFSGCIHDIKVQGRKRAPDDAMYNKYADLR